MVSLEQCKSILLGIAVGDALGVPYEFLSKDRMDAKPATTMTGGGTHGQPPGTWSDDSSLTFCLAEMLVTGYDLQNLANRFINWYHHGYWTAHNEVFDIGNTTRHAISNLAEGINPVQAGGCDEDSNGNGSLMRILPLALLIKGWKINERYYAVNDVSSLTHGHIRSVISCFIYIEIAIKLLNGESFENALKHIRTNVIDFILNQGICTEKELSNFNSVLLYTNIDETLKPIEQYHRDDIRGSGYVLDTLKASLWCIANTNSYSGAVLAAVNLGQDTDTTGCVTGGLAGIIYGSESIPSDWLKVLARRDDIDLLAARLSKVLG